MSVTNVRDLLNTKSDSRVITASPDMTVFDALKLMGKLNIGGLIVTEGHIIVGMMTERDYARKVVLKNRSSRDTRVSEIMSTSIVYVQLHDSIDECMALMTEKRIRHLPVLDAGKLVGLVSIGDVVKAKISDQAFIIDQLTRYITGSPEITYP